MNLLAFLLSIFAAPEQTWELLPAVDSGLISVSSVITDQDGLPWVAYEKGRETPDGYDASIFVKRYDGTQWQTVGQELDICPDDNTGSPSLMVAKDGQIYATWFEEADAINGNFNVHVKRWDGEAWQSLGDAVDINKSQGALVPVLTTDQQSRPVIAWAEFNESLFSLEVNVSRWEVDRWVPLGGPLNGELGQSGAPKAIAINNHNQPLVVFTQGSKLLVKRWNGRDWVALADAINPQSVSPETSASLALNKSGSPYVSWSIPVEGGGYAVQVSRWDYPTRTWQPLKLVGKPGVDRPGFDNQLYIDAKNRIRISWSDDDTLDRCVSQWEPLSEVWIQVGPQPFAASIRQTASLSGDGEGDLFLTAVNPLDELVVWNYRWSPRLFRKRYEAWLGDEEPDRSFGIFITSGSIPEFSLSIISN